MATVWLIRVLAPLMGLAILAFTLPQLLTAPERAASLPAGFRLRGLALELVDTKADLEQIQAKYKSDNKTIESEITMDFALGIPVYLITFVSIGLWLFRHQELPFNLALAAAIVICVTAAAGFDVLENLNILGAVHHPPTSIPDQIRHAAIMKWLLLCITLLFTATPFLWSRSWFAVVGLIYLASAVVGIVGLIGPRWLVQIMFVLMGLALIPTGEAVWRLTAKTLLAP
jgi:hypothetical protein